MAGRSLQASSEGIELARKQLKIKSLTQKVTYERLGLSKATVGSFLEGNPLIEIILLIFVINWI